MDGNCVHCINISITCSGAACTTDAFFVRHSDSEFTILCAAFAEIIAQLFRRLKCKCQKAHPWTVIQNSRRYQLCSVVFVMIMLIDVDGDDDDDDRIVA